MVSPKNVAEFHADYDKHPDDRVRLFAAVANAIPNDAQVLYPGSYVDIAPSVWFDEVTYVDLDKRSAAFFEHAAAVAQLVDSKRRALGRPTEATFSFHHLDYQTRMPLENKGFDLLVSLYAGFVSEHCTKHLAIGGTLLVNPSHGDAAMASIDQRYELTGIVESNGGGYQVGTDELDTYLIPKKGQAISIESLHASGRGIGYTRSPFAYLFTRRR